MLTDQYCATMENLDPVEAIRAIHAAWLQIEAERQGLASLDHGDALARLAKCLRQAGHIGFTP